MINKFAIRLKNLREHNNLTQEQLAKKIGVSTSLIGLYETGARKPSRERLSSLSTLFDVSMDYLMGKTDTIFEPKTSAVYEATVDYNSGETNIDSVDVSFFVNLPVVGTIRGGEPILAIQNIEGYFPTDKRFLRPGHEYFYLRVKGDSMDKEFPEGSLVLVQRQSDVDNGDVAAVLVNKDEATVKQVYKKNNIITLMPQSHNPEHQPTSIDTTKENIDIIGKVKMAVKYYY
jgi:repressor LexA